MHFTRYSGGLEDIHTPLATIDKIGPDVSGLASYSFNSLGYRGAEYIQDRLYSIFVCGCSYTFGLGLDYEKTWPCLLAESISEQMDEEINLMNFSQSGGSNDYITRTMLTQMRAVKPSLLVVLFTFPNRAEIVADNKIVSVGPWLEGNLASAYYAQYSESSGMINLAKNILLLQDFCSDRGIEWLFGTVEGTPIGQETSTSFSRPFEILIDTDRYAGEAFIGPSFFIDRAADGGHPGVEANKSYANYLFDFFKQSNINLGRTICV